MRKMKKGSAQLLLLIGLCLFLTEGIWADKWYRDYEKAVLAAKKGVWSEVIVHIRESLGKRDKPKYQARTVGLEFVDYFPYYHLGLAHYRLGQYKEAEEALDQSRAYGEIAKVPEMTRETELMLRDCRSRLLAQKEPASQPASLEPKMTVPEKADQKKDVPALVADAVPPKTERQTVLPEKKTPSANPEAAPPSRKELENSAEKDPLEGVKDDLVREGTELLQRGDLDGARQKFDALLQLDETHSLALSARKRIEQGQQIRKVNQGLRLYFSGQGRMAEDLLSGVLGQEGVDQRILALAHQFLAFILAERHFTEGDPSGAILQQARDQYEKALQLGGGVLAPPDKRFFSPKILKLFNLIKRE